jgi:hypothetical protein
MRAARRSWRRGTTDRPRRKRSHGRKKAEPAARLGKYRGSKRWKLEKPSVSNAHSVYISSQNGILAQPLRVSALLRLYADPPNIFMESRSWRERITPDKRALEPVSKPIRNERKATVLKGLMGTAGG